MKTIMIVSFTLLFLGLSGVLFYWFQVRTSDIRKNCYSWSIEKAKELTKSRIDVAPGEPTNEGKVLIEQGFFNKDDQKDYYENCLHKEGLK